MLMPSPPLSPSCVDSKPPSRVDYKPHLTRFSSNRLVSACHTKCIQPDAQKHRYAEGELLKGEAVCIDRCTAKFFEVNKKVGERMSAMGGQAQQTGSFGR